MNWVFFVLGFLAFPLLVAPILLRYGKNWVWIPPDKPAHVDTVVGLQPFVKRLMKRGGDGDQLFVRSCDPQFLVRIRKRLYKTKPAVLEIEIRASDANAIYFVNVRDALVDEGYHLRQRQTPKLNKPKDLRISFDVGAFAPAAVASVLRRVFQTVGVDENKGMNASFRDPVFWRGAA